MIRNEMEQRTIKSVIGAHSKRVLCYAPYNMWALHGMWEITILQALKLRGADVQYALCDGLYSDCDVYWAATNPRHTMSCTQCQASVANLANSMGMPFVWLGRYLLPDDFREARQWVGSLAIDDLLTATYQDWNIGEWVESSVHSHLRITDLDFSVPQIKDVFQSYLYSGLIACLGINRLLDDYNPEVLFLFNGRQSSTRVALEIARKRGTRVICHERGSLKESLKLTENIPCISLHAIKQVWQYWKDIPLIPDELEEISQYMHGRQFGMNLNWRSYSPEPQDVTSIRRNLGLNPDRPLFVLFNSSDDELIAHKEWQGPFSRQTDWIKKTVNFAERHPEVDWVIRVHPNIAGKKATGNNFQQLQDFENLGNRLPRNVRLVMPEDPISSYSLMDLANLGLVYMSTVGLEMACKGKNVIVAGGGWLHDKPFVKTVQSAEAYEKMLEAFLRPSVQHNEDNCLDIKRMAYRFAYSVFFRLSIPFPLVTMPDPHTGRVAYNSLDALLPGKEPNLDRIARIILENEPVILPPTQAGKNRSAMDEEQWLKQHMAKNMSSLPQDFSKPKVSVIIPCYNYARYLENCVKSVIGQTYQDFEIIIVNDGSTDNTQEVAEQLIAAHPNYRIHLINQANSGQPAISRNRGIAEAKGIYILPLDADDMIASSMLEECVSILENNPSLAIAYTDRLDFDGVDQEVHAGDYDFSRLRYANHISYCALFRKEVWNALGGYRTNVKGCEDWDFWVAAGSRGYFGRRIAKPLFMYRRHDTGLYQEVINNLERKHAQIILNNREAYEAKYIVAAEKLLEKNGEGLAIAQPMVSIIIPTLNRPAMLGEAIQSVLRQIFQDFEIIVVNDGGLDVREVVNQYNQSGKIVYLQHDRNRGLAVARNTGIKVARGKYIAYLDDDDIYYPDHLETLVNFLESSEYKVAYTNAFRAFQKVQNGQYITIKKDVPYSYDFDYERILRENFIPVLCIIYEKSCLDSVGLFDETLRAHEDWDLWMRMSRLFKFAHIKKLTCEFSWRDDGSSMTFGRKGDMEKTRQIVFQRGQKLLKEGYYQTKIMKLQINADYEYKKIKPLIDSGRCEEAIIPLEKIITSYPAYAPAHNDLAVLYYHQGDKEKSIIHYEKAVSLNPGNPNFLKNLGDFYYVELKRIDEAIHLYQKVLAITPVDLETLLILGNIHVELKNFDEARSYYTKALETDPSNELARKCVEAFLRWKPFEAAEGDPEEDYREARILIQSGKEDKAIDKLEKLIHGHPRHALAHNDLGYLYYNRGERTKALTHYEKAVELNPENLTSMKNLADFYYVELKRIDEAIPLYEKVLSMHPMDGETLLILGNIHVELEKFLDARAYYLKVLEIDPSNELASKMVEALKRRQQEAGLDLDRENIAGQNLGAIARLDSEGLQAREASLRRKVSIIIPVFNKVEYTQKCLAAIFRHTEKNLYEIVVVDNASTDGTGKYLKGLGDKVKIVTNRENLGFAKACNQGAAIASSEYLLFLNNDTEPKAKWLEPLVKTLDGSVSIAAVGSKLLFPDGTIQHAGIAIIEDRKLPDPLVARHLYYRQPSDLPEANVPRQYQALTAACLLIRKDAFDEVKRFDEGYWNGYEDVDLCFKVRERGWRIIYQPESVVIHFESQSGKERFAKISKNISRLHEKWLGKVKPDLIIEKDGTAKETRAAGNLPYSMVKKPEAILESSHQQEKRVSIVILTFNQLAYTQKCVESIQKHTPEPHEILFVDNGSMDGTAKWLRQLVKKNGNYKLIANGKNLGFAKGCNQGIKASSGEYILLLNNDVVVTENWLSGMLECINSLPDIGVVGPMTNNISGFQKVVNADYGDIDHLEGYARALREKNRYQRIPTRRIVGFCMLFSRELVDKIGLLDEPFGSGNYEDDDFCLRASLEGYKNLIAGDVFVHHYGSRSFIGNRIDYNSSMLANRKTFNEKWNGLDAQSALGKKALSLKAMEKADELNQKGQNDEAVNILIGGIKLFPDDRNLYCAFSEMLIDFKKYKDALGILNEMPPDNNDIRKLGLIGYCKEGMELYEEAQEYADRALLLNPTSPLALNLKGILAYKKGDKSTAESFFKKAFEADPGYGEPYTNFGVLKWGAEQKEEALNFLEKGFILSPTITDIVTAYYSAITATGEFSRAERVFQEIKGLYPLNRRIAFLLIDILIQQGKNKVAMENIEDAMIAFGVDDGILSAAIEMRNRIGIKEIDVETKGKSTLSLCMIVKNEERYLAKCLRSVEPVVDEMIVVDTGSTDRTKEIAEAFGAKVYELGWPESFAEARNYSISKASGRWILIMDADEVISPKDYDKLSSLLKNGRPSSSAYSFVTRNYVTRSNVEGWRENDRTYNVEETGIGWFPSQKVRLFPNDKRIRFENPVHEFVEASLSRAGIDIKLGNIIIHHYGKLDEEKSFLKGETYYYLGKRKLDEMGRNVYALRELAIQAAELKKYDESVELWKKLILLQPDNASAFLNLGHSYLELGRYEDALLASKKAMELDPKMKEAVHNYCVCELCSGQVQKVIAALESLLKRVPGYPSAEGLLGAACIVDGRTKMGLEYIEKIWKNKTDAAEYLFNTAARLLKAGKKEYAISLLEVAVESKNVNNAILALREECKKIAEFRNECGQKESISFPVQV